MSHDRVCGSDCVISGSCARCCTGLIIRLAVEAVKGLIKFAADRPECDSSRIQRGAGCYNEGMSEAIKETPVQAPPQNEPLVCTARCCACGRCIEACPEGVLAAGEGQTIVAHPELCDACLACEDVCPQGAIEISFAIVWGDQDAGRTEHA